MNKKTLSSLAALGLITGAMETAHAGCKPPSSSQVQSLFSQLDSDHQAMYNSMDCEGQRLAMDMASYTCKGNNKCKGQGSCKTDKNSCVGQNDCKGKSPGAFQDKNQAVEMAQKRMQAMGK